MKQIFPCLLLAIILNSAVSNAEPLDLNLPSIGESAQRYLSPAADHRLGEAFMRGLRRALVFIDDAIITDYLRVLGYQLVAMGDTPTHSFDFFVVDDPRINAFAGPGGHIGVNAGLILATDAESELAAVIAHEVAHVSQHHLARAMEMAESMSIPSIAAMLAAIVIASQSGQAGQAAIMAAAAGNTQMQLDFIRGNEQEADRVGIQALVKADFDPRAMAGFFERLLKSTRYYDLGMVPEFLRDHPVTAARIADARNRAEQFAYRQRPDALAYHLIRARLKVRTFTSPAQGVKELQQALTNGSYRNRAAARYAYALALLANKEFPAARTAITQLLADDPARIPYLITQADIAVAMGDVPAALACYRQAQQLYPHHPAITINEVQTLLWANRPKEARDLLQNLIRNRASDPGLYQLLARAEEATGNLPAAREAVAEYLYFTGETSTAIHELRKASILTNVDFYASSRMDARIKEWEEELLAEKNRANK